MTTTGITTTTITDFLHSARDMKLKALRGPLVHCTARSSDHICLRHSTEGCNKHSSRSAPSFLSSAWIIAPVRRLASTTATSQDAGNRRELHSIITHISLSLSLSLSLSRALCLSRKTFRRACGASLIGDHFHSSGLYFREQTVAVEPTLTLHFILPPAASSPRHSTPSTTYCILPLPLTVVCSSPLLRCIKHLAHDRVCTNKRRCYCRGLLAAVPYLSRCFALLWGKEGWQTQPPARQSTPSTIGFGRFSLCLSRVRGSG